MAAQTLTLEPRRCQPRHNVVFAIEGSSRRPGTAQEASTCSPDIVVTAPVLLVLLVDFHLGSAASVATDNIYNDNNNANGEM